MYLAPSLIRLHILRPGHFTAMGGEPIELTQADLADLAETYDPERYEAPIVVGHPADNDPAYGWVARLEVDAEGLHAVPSHIAPELRQAVAERRYRQVSASLYPPSSSANPHPGKWSLRHVGVLGAQPPAVKGLRSIQLGDGAGCVCLSLPNEDLSMAETPMADDVTAQQAELEQRLAEVTVQQAALAAQLAELAEREQQLAQREQQVAQAEARMAMEMATRRTQEITDFAEGLVQAGKLLPRDQSLVVGVLDHFAAAPLNFAEGDAQVDIGTRLRAFLESQPVQVDFGERSAGQTTEPPPDNQSIARRASAYKNTEEAAGRSISFSQAVDAVRAGKDLV